MDLNICVCIYIYARRTSKRCFLLTCLTQDTRPIVNLNMADKMLFLHLFTAIAVIVPLQSSRLNRHWNDITVYGDNVSERELTNILDFGIGTLNFLQYYMNQEIPDSFTIWSSVWFRGNKKSAGTAGATIAARLSEIHQKYYWSKLDLKRIFLWTSHFSFPCCS